MVKEHYERNQKSRDFQLCDFDQMTENLKIQN